jgi:hypothetical protein
VAAWLLHCADPLGPKFDPPQKQLSARQVRKLFVKANAHKVLPSVLRHYPVCQLKLDEIRQEADLWRVEAAALSTMLKFHASAVAEAANQLPIALVKGPAFAVLYPPGFRPYGDIDFLVAPSARSDLASILTAQGFHRTEYNPIHLEEVWIHRENHVLKIEVHTNIVHHPRMRAAFSLTHEHLEGIFERPAALLSVAIMHGAMHYFAWLRHVLDIRQAARLVSTPAEEALFERLTHRTGTRMAAVIGLILADRLFSDERSRTIAGSLGSARDYRFARTLIEGAVLTATMEGRVVYNGWRRFVLRELLLYGK